MHRQFYQRLHIWSFQLSIDPNPLTNRFYCNKVKKQTSSKQWKIHYLLIYGELMEGSSNIDIINPPPPMWKPGLMSIPSVTNIACVAMQTMYTSINNRNISSLVKTMYLSLMNPILYCFTVMDKLKLN